MNNPLCMPLETAQQLLLTTIWAPYEENLRWPLWGYVAHRFDRSGVDAAEVLASLPVVVLPSGGGAYGPVWSAKRGEPDVHSEVRLTVAGLFHIPAAAKTLNAFIAMLCAVDRAYLEHANDDPYSVPQELSAGRFEGIRSAVVVALTGAMEENLDPDVSHLEPRLAGILDLGEREPYTSPFPRSSGESSFLRSDKPRFLPPNAGAVLREFRSHLDSPRTYLDHMYERLSGPTKVPVPRSPHPYDIAQSLSHLNAVWRAAFKQPLLLGLDPLPVARLTEVRCETEAEFDSLMSALADVMSRFTSPAATKPADTKQLEKVRDYLERQKLDDGSKAQITQAFDNLIRLKRIRVAGQHTDAKDQVVTAYRELGLSYPPENWITAWNEIANVARGNFDIIRQEIQASEGIFASNGQG